MEFDSVFLLRIGRKARWEPPSGAADPSILVENAVADLRLRPGEDGLSVFQVEGIADSQEIAARFALTCSARVAAIDYITFPESLAVELGLPVVNAPDEALESTLSARHREILGLTEEMARRLTASILASGELRVVRIRDRELVGLGITLCRHDPTLRDHLKPNWEVTLAPILFDPPAT